MIQDYMFYSHPNPDQATPKVWGGGSEVNGGDLLFFGAADKTLSMQAKARRYVRNKAPDKVRDGYREVIRLNQIDKADAVALTNQIAKAIVDCVRTRQVDMKDVPMEHRSEVAAFFRREYPNAVLVNMLAQSLAPKIKPIAAAEPGLTKLIRDVQSKQEAAPVTDLSW
ncbi:hypothetical protein [Noviherbaspirillum galbum]|uniref:hypothetical protein n=1 Tax=Noviherbaspirillum galbum TaxID=2709383 RepID=UPI0013D67B86|nr:hypothetical protein [Noviherbaspirillum galbum]